MSDRLCLGCGISVAHLPRAEWCSNRCYQRVWAVLARRADPEKSRAYKRQFYAANIDKERRRTREWQIRNPESVLATKRKYLTEHPEKNRQWAETRRARVLGAFVAPVELPEVFARSKGRCHICGYPVDWDVPWPEPMSKVMDHVIPIARGGTHEPSNILLAHNRCNARKHDKIVRPTQATLRW